MRTLSRMMLTFVVGTLVLTGCSSSGSTVEGEVWILESFADPATVVQSDEVVASSFTLSDGTISGNGGVNSFNGAYVLSDDQITISPLGSTRMAGPPQAMEQESEFFRALESAARLESTGSALDVLDSNNVVLMSLRAAQG